MEKLEVSHCSHISWLYDSSSQIDFVATRRNNVDAISKCAEVLLILHRGGKVPRIALLYAAYNFVDVGARRPQYHASRYTTAGSSSTQSHTMMTEQCSYRRRLHMRWQTCMTLRSLVQSATKAWQTLNVKHTLAGMWSAYRSCAALQEPDYL